MNHKFRLLQHLIDRVGHNENLKNFGHDSSSSVYEFLVYIGDYLLKDMRRRPRSQAAGHCSALLVDETTDITTLKQFMFIVRYIHKGDPKTFFLDISPLEIGCATATNIFKTCKQVANDYGLDVRDNFANAADRADAMVGAHNPLGQKIKTTSDKVVNKHCSVDQAVCQQLMDLMV